MSQADRIRQFVLEQYVAPARARGQKEVTVRAGDVHEQMSLLNAMPSVCSAIGSSKFEELAGVTKTTLQGPSNGANAYFTFSLERVSAPLSRVHTRKRVVQHAPLQHSESIDLDKALVLVSCVKSKLPHSAHARALYTSTWFIKVRDFVEQHGARWFILSALYGLVAPDAQIAPYDHTLNAATVVKRKQWAIRVLDDLLPVLTEKRVVMFAGLRYREFIVPPLLKRGIEVQVPMESLRQGEQLHWLSQLT